MVRVKRGFVARNRRRKLLNRAKGFRGAIGTIFRPAKQAVMKALQYATVHRRARKRDMRSLWIVRIGAAARHEGLSYSKLISGLKSAKVMIDRKNLADMAVNDPAAFSKLAEFVKTAKK